jgi:acyl-CoA thioesterase
MTNRCDPTPTSGLQHVGSLPCAEACKEYRLGLPQVSGPEGPVGWPDYLAAIQDEILEEMPYWFGRPRPIRTRPSNVEPLFKPVFENPPISPLRLGATAPVPDDYALQQALLN